MANPIAAKLRQAGFELEDSNVPELAAMLLIAANEIDRLDPPLKHATWFDGGYLGNGHCSFMWARNGSGACCNLPHGHEGPHQEDPPPPAANVNHVTE